MSRLDRALSQRILLVKLDVEDRQMTFHVLGSSQRVYKVVYRLRESPTCGCPDNRLRKVPCEHILFVAALGLRDLSDWAAVPDVRAAGQALQDTVQRKYEAASGCGAAPQGKRRNEDCYMCIESIGAGEPDVVCRTCLNGVHEACWCSWMQHSKKNKCPMCRAVMASSSTA